jgi:predicted SAM-dependent methyltransferase
MVEVKLHLGCGNKEIEGYINVDCRFLPSVDVVDNVRFLRSFKKNSVDVIYACHVLEHFSRWDYRQVLQRWHEILKPGGILRIAVPDFEKLVQHYLKTKNLRDISGLLYGGQDYPENNHFWCWDYSEMQKDLEETGFKNIRPYDWRKTDHFYVDDFSQAYLPHMDKENGILVSLNIESVKSKF